MSILFRKRKVSILSIALDAPQNTISSLPGFSVKTTYTGVIGQE